MPYEFNMNRKLNYPVPKFAFKGCSFLGKIPLTSWYRSTNKSGLKILGDYTWVLNTNSLN
jgi:hypothetical protein